MPDPNFSSFIWSVADLLRGDYKQSEYGKVKAAQDELNALMLGKPPRVVTPTAASVAPDDRKPILADYMKDEHKKLTLRGHHKGKNVWAYVSKTGLIWFQDQHFTSPSLAGAVAVQRKTCNGWTFWQYQRAPGDWVPLDNLRK